MTFTRKAAAEMRERIVAALRAAAEAPSRGEPSPSRGEPQLPPTSDHHAKTRRLAAAALARDRALGWQLVAHPARLAIYTIDAFCASLVRQAPIATGLGSLPRFEEHAEPCIRKPPAKPLPRPRPATSSGARCSPISTTTPSAWSRCWRRCWASATSGCPVSALRPRMLCGSSWSKRCSRRSPASSIKSGACSPPTRSRHSRAVPPTRPPISGAMAATRSLPRRSPGVSQPEACRRRNGSSATTGARWRTGCW